MKLDQKELGTRLRIARESCGLAQEDVAKSLALSCSTIEQIERGERKISTVELEGMSYLFGRSLSAFFQNDFHEDDVFTALFHAHSPFLEKNEAQKALRDNLELARELTALERMLSVSRHPGILATYPTPFPQTHWEATEQGIRVAEEERRRLGLGIQPIASVAELLASQGILTAELPLPEEISGLTVYEPRMGVFVIINQKLSPPHRRFSLAHEYAHVLFDRERRSNISRSSERHELIEIRANAFAIHFLAPEEGVSEFVAALGKGWNRRSEATLYDEEEAIQVFTAPQAEYGNIQIYDVMQLACHYKISRRATLYHLYNLKILLEREFHELLDIENSGRTHDIADILQIPESDEPAPHHDFKHRLVSLALEAYRREEITYAKLSELSALVFLSTYQLDFLLAELGLAEKEATDIILPQT